jgi:hypothetical protein
MIGVVVCSFGFGLTLGSYGSAGESLLPNLRAAEWANIGEALLAGAIFNVANLLLVTAIDIAGMAVKLHWHGGDHTELIARKNPSGTSHFATDTDTVELIRSLARLLPDASIAAVLNRVGKRTTRGNTWNAVRVCAFRSSHDIAVYRDGERAERGEVNLEEAAQLFQVKSMTVLRLIQRKVLVAHPPCVGAPWSICRDDLDSSAVRQALTGGRYDDPLTPEPGQGSLDFQ